MESFSENYISSNDTYCNWLKRAMDQAISSFALDGITFTDGQKESIKAELDNDKLKLLIRKKADGINNEWFM